MDWLTPSPCQNQNNIIKEYALILMGRLVGMDEMVIALDGQANMIKLGFTHSIVGKICTAK